MPLQYPTQSPYNPYVEPKRPVNWPKIILLSITVIVIVLVVGLAIFNNIRNNESYYIGKANDAEIDNLFNNPNNQGIAVGEPNPSGYDCTKDIYNCANFTTQAQAQVAFDSCFKIAGDIHQLDADGNGKACEGLR